MSNPIASLPFFVKLTICIFIDLLSLAFAAIQGSALAISILTLISPVMPASITVLAGSLTSGVVIALIQVALLLMFYSWNLMPIIGAVAFAEMIPVVNALPFCTAIALWNGYKTGWRN